MPNEKQVKKEAVIRTRTSIELKEAFDKVCAERGYNGSAIVRKLIEQWLERELKNKP